MIIGGEFCTDDRWLMDQPAVDTSQMIFLNGGQACLRVIGAWLRDHGIERILLPSYLCPSIVNVLEQSGIACAYYQINPDFSINLTDLAEKAGRHRAVYFINYFGFQISNPAREVFTGLQEKGLVVIEDNAQAGFVDRVTGDFGLNSMRKLTAHDGGYLISRHAVMPYIPDHLPEFNSRLPLIRQYRQQLAEYLFRGIGSHDALSRLYAQAEAYYESDRVIPGDAHEREQIERQDWQRIKQIRRDNYNYLLGLIAGIPEMSPIFPVLQENNLPLGLPVYITGVSRDELFNELGNAGIGLTIHWEELLTDPRLNKNPVAVDMASRILTLVIDQRTSHKQLDTMTQILMDRLKIARLKA